MAIGPGKYDDVATLVRQLTSAEGVVVVVLDGIRGHGFSVQATSGFGARTVALALRSVADEIEKDMRTGAP